VNTVIVRRAFVFSDPESPSTFVSMDRLLSTIRALLAQPTAPFHEDAVRAEILMLLAQCPHVSVEQDDFGNLIAHYRRGPELAVYALAAHMDHPAYVGDEFLGGVPEEYRTPRPPVRDFGAFAMWDLPACEVRDGRIYSRACDDLIGCASIVTMFQVLEATGAECACYGLFTRAEEVGFIGAIQLSRSGRIPREVTVVSLETSSEKAPGAGKMGDGVIVRVGDKTSLFDPDETATLWQRAQDAKIPAQRCLMSGGTCEATAYQLYGYRCAALCVALGNYHNCGPDHTIAPEFVALADAEALTALCVAAARGGESPDPRAQLRSRLEARVEEYRRFFQA
jgi:endoglucanase